MLAALVREPIFCPEVLAGRVNSVGRVENDKHVKMKKTEKEKKKK